MKINRSHILLSAILALFIGVNVYSQNPETHYITLNVNTAVVNTQNASEVSNFGQGEDISNEDFTISVRIGDTVIWRGFSNTSQNDVVNIVSINYEGGANIFDQNILRGNGDDPELVVGTVVSGNVGDTLKYKISFTVLNDGTRRQGTYHIDPKIRIK